MTPEAAERCAALLREARRSRRPLPELPEEIRPRSLEEGYQAQDAFVAAAGGAICGYKIAATGQVAQELLKVDGPFYGQVLEGKRYEAPVTLPAGDYLFRLIEPEFIFVMGEDLPPREANYDSAEVSSAVASLHPGFEIVCSAYGLDWTKRGAPSIAADDAVNAGVVLGPGREDWRSLNLAEQEVRLYLDGEFLAAGKGANVLGHPLRALTWIANKLSARGRTLKAGEFVSTGLVTERFALPEAGQVCRADFGSLGSVVLGFK